MAYGPKYRVGGASIDGHTYTADIEQDGYSGSVTEFTAAASGLRLRWDLQSRQDLNEPWMIGTGSIEVKEEDPSALAEIFDGGTFEYRVRLFQDGDEYFVGFVQTDQYRDSTWQAVSDPRIKFTDGLGKLSNIAFSEAGAEEDVREAIMRVLAILPTDLKAEINMRWMPNGVSGLPIEKLYVPDEAWVEDDTETAPNPAPKRKSGRAVLRGLLRRFGMRLMQSGGQWRMRQRLSLMDDTLTASIYNPDGSLASTTTGSGRERDLTALNADEESRSFQSKFGASSVKYNFKTPLDQVFPNPSFEDTLTRWNTAGDAQRVDIDTVSDLQKTSGDQKAVKMTTNDANLNLQDAIELPPDPRIAMIVQWGDVRDTKVGKISVETDSGYDLRRRTVIVDNPALPGEETTLQLVQEVGQIGGGEVTGMPIVPAGAELKLYTSDPSVSPVGNKIRLTEPLRVGDESVTGELAQEITSTSNQNLKPLLAYWQWADFSNSEETRISNDNYFTRHSLEVFMVHPSGTPVDGSVDVSWFMKDDTSSGFYALDDVSLKFQRDGELIESFSTTTVDDTGDREVLEVPVGIGPTDRSESRVYTQSEDTPEGWGRDSSGSYTLGALHSKESLQAQRTSPETRRFSLRLRADDPDVLPHHIYLDGSTRYEAIALQRDLLQGIARLNLAELQNDGTNGLSVTTAFNSEEDTTSQGGGGSSVQVLDGSGGGASTWDDLTGKPSGLFAQNGDSDGFGETQALAAGDLATALSHSPGLSGGIQTSIRASGSATDDALATEQAIREAIGSAGASQLSGLSDVDSAVQSDGNVLASGGAAYREESISSLLQGHAQHSDLNGIGPDDHHAQDHDHTSADVSTVPNAGLTNSAVIVAGNSVALGGSTTVSVTDLSDVDALRTSIRESANATNSALGTEAAIRSAIGTAIDGAAIQVDLGDDGTAEIDPLQQISTTGDTNGIFSAGNESGELAVDVSDVAILTENETFTNGLNVTGGSVGIGTTSPSYALDVSGDVNLTGTLRNNGSQVYARTDLNETITGFWEFPDADNPNNPSISFPQGSGIVEGTGNGAISNDNLSLSGRNGFEFYQFDGSAWNKIGQFSDLGDWGLGLNGGLVGIGTNNPSYSLDVDGDLRAQGTIRNDWTDLQNVSHSSLQDTQVGYYDGQNSEWINGYIADLIRERGALSVGDVSFAASWRTFEQDSQPDPNNVSIEDGDVWIDTDATPVAEAYVWRNSQWNKTASAIGGNNIVTDSINTDKLTADAVTTNELEAGAARIGDVLVSGNNITKSDTAPNDPQEFDIWIDTTTDPPTSKYWDGSQWVSQTLITGDLVSTDTIYARHIRANEIDAAQIDTDTFFAAQATIDSLTSTTALIDDLTAEIFAAEDATIEGQLQLGTNAPYFVLDGENDRIESSNYVSGQAGTRFTPNFLEVKDIEARAELRTAVLKEDRTLAVGGEQVISSTTKLYSNPTSIPRITGTTQTGRDLEVQWQKQEKHIRLQDDIAAPGERIRMKDAQGGSREVIATVQERYYQSDHVLLTLDTAITRSWGEGTTVVRWGEHIREVADGEFAPFTAYVDEDLNEQVRIGNLNGRAGLTGYGMVVGDDQLVYSSDDDTLTVRGRAEIDEGFFGPYEIKDEGISSNTLTLSEDRDTLSFLEESASETGVVANPDFTSTKTLDYSTYNAAADWTQIHDHQAYLIARANGGALFGQLEDGDIPNFISTAPTFEVEVEQSVDVTAFDGQILTVELDAATIGPVEYKSRSYSTFYNSWTVDYFDVSGRVQFEVIYNGEVLTSATMGAGDGSIQTQTASFRVPNGASSVTVRVACTAPHSRLGLRSEGDIKSAIEGESFTENVEVVENFGEVFTVYDVTDVGLTESTSSPGLNDGQIAAVYSVNLTGRSVKAQYQRSGVTLFDDSLNKTFELDRTSGDLTTAGKVGLGFAGAGLYVNGSGEVIAEDEAGNTTQLT